MKGFSALTAFKRIASCVRTLGTLAATALWVAAATAAHAQFRPIPNYVGIGAGAQFRNDINNHLSGAAAVAPRIVSLPFAQLPTEQDGQEYWCSDCKQTNPCLGGGQAALAVGMQGQWNCLAGANGTTLGAFPLGGNVSAASHKIQNLAADAATGDALSRGQSTLNALAPPTAPYAMGNQPLIGLPAASGGGQAIAYGQGGAQLTANQPSGAVVSSSSANGGNETSQIITAPMSIANGNVLLLVGAFSNNGISGNTPGTITPPTGFTQLRFDVNPTANSPSAGLFCKVASGESGSYTISWTNAQNFAGGIINISGVTGCTPDATNAASSGSASTSFTGPTLSLTNLRDFDIGFVTSNGSQATGAPGILIFNPTSGSAAAGAAYSRTISGYTASGLTGFVNGSRPIIQQVAFAPSGTIQGAPLVANQQSVTVGNLTANVNNVLSVMAAPYYAQGDGNTDDLAAIQSAVYDACGLTNPPTGIPLVTATKAVYLPSPPVSYLHSAPIRIPCKGLEFYGTGASKLSQNYYGHAIIQGSWGVANLPRATSLVSGPGNSLPVAADIPHVIDVGRFANGTGSNNLAGHFGSGFNIALYVKHTATGGIILQSSPSYPGSGDAAFSLNYGVGDAVTMFVNTTGGVITLPTCPAQTQGTTYELELDWDGTTYRAWQGVPGGTAVSCGTTASANPMVQSPFEVIMLAPHGRTGSWPVAGDGGIDGAMVGNLDSIRFETGSVHTATYTVPTTKFSADGNTYYLNNFETSLDGTQIGHTGTNGTVYSTVTGGNIGYTASANIHDLELCGGSTANADGLWAFGADSSIWKNLYCSNAYYSGYDLNGSSFFARAENLHSAGGHYGADYGGAFNGSMAINNGYDGNDVACVVHEGGGGGAYENYHEKCVNRGNLRYGWIEDQSSANYFYPDMDMEGGVTNFVASVLLNAPSGYYFYGAGLSAANGTSFIQQDNGGSGSTFIGAHFGAVSGTPNYIINYTNGTPTTPTQLINTVNPVGVPLSNQPGNPYILELGAGAGANSLLQNLELQQVPKFDAGVAHLIVNPIADPAAATISVIGATAGTAYGPYFVVCRDSNGGVTLPSASSNTVANGPASLTSGNYINIAWSAVVGCATWDVLKNSTGTSLALGVTGTSYHDVGGATSAYTAPTRNTTGDISGLAQISAGTTFTKLPGTVVNGMRVYCSNCDPPANPPVACSSAGARSGAFADGVNNQWLCAP